MDTHNYTLVVYDEAGHWARHTVIVTVLESGALDTTPPTIDQPADLTYEVGSTGHFLTWQPTDAHPANYTIYANGQEVATGTWDGSAIAIYVDNLTVGIYNYTLVVYDEVGRV